MDAFSVEIDEQGKVTLCFGRNYRMVGSLVWALRHLTEVAEDDESDRYPYPDDDALEDCVAIQTAIRTKVDLERAIDDANDAMLEN